MRATAAFVGLVALAAGAAAQDEVVATPDRQTAKERTIAALAASGFAVDAVRDDLEAVWASESSNLQAVAQSAALVHDGVRLAAADAVPARHERWEAPAFLFDPDLDPFLRANLALHLAQRLARADYLDEALALLSQVAAEEVVDPAAQYFLSAICNYHLGLRSEAMEAVLEFQRVESPPERYKATVELLRLSLQQSNPDSLAAVADEMRDVRRRLDLGKTDAQVQQAEDAIVRKLDAMIEELEKERGGQESSSESPSPNDPAPESAPLGGEGEGGVDAKRIAARSEWGNLPPREREKVLQEIGRDLPSHYRDAVEQYFRKLAETPLRKAP